MRTVAIIQARMGSTRLPGKVLMDFGGQTLLGFLIDRLAVSETLDDIVVATTVLTRDDAVAAEAARKGVRHFRGSEADVLGRYMAAARASRAEIVLRVTGDNPFTDPGSIDRVVRRLESGFDYAIENDLPVGTTGEGLTAEAMALLDAVAAAPRWREHVTLYAKENPGFLKCSFMRPEPELARPDLSFTVDRMSEYRHAAAFCDKFSDMQFSLKDLIALADMSVVGV